MGNLQRPLQIDYSRIKENYGGLFTDAETLHADIPGKTAQRAEYLRDLGIYTNENNNHELLSSNRENPTATDRYGETLEAKLELVGILSTQDTRVKDSFLYDHITGLLEYSEGRRTTWGVLSSLHLTENYATDTRLNSQDLRKVLRVARAEFLFELGILATRSGNEKHSRNLPSLSSINPEDLSYYAGVYRELIKDLNKQPAAIREMGKSYIDALNQANVESKDDFEFIRRVYEAFYKSSNSKRAIGRLLVYELKVLQRFYERKLADQTMSSFDAYFIDRYVRSYFSKTKEEQKTRPLDSFCAAVNGLTGIPVDDTAIFSHIWVRALARPDLLYDEDGSD